MAIFLKVKAASLAAEARIIRRLELRIKRSKRWATQGPIWDSYVALRDHRKLAIRDEARSTHLARAFLRGHAYEAIERTCHKDPTWKNVERLILRYGRGDQAELKARFRQWVPANSILKLAA